MDDIINNVSFKCDRGVFSQFILQNIFFSSKRFSRTKEQKPYFDKSK